jgi:uncharacterized membrane protein
VLIVIGGLVVGLIVGRWWALIAAVGFGVWAWTVSELEVPDWFIGLVYGLLAAIGIALGVIARRLAKRFLKRA